MDGAQWECYWYLQHKRANRRISCKSRETMIAEFYRQWRDVDGSIPWVMTMEYVARTDRE